MKKGMVKLFLVILTLCVPLVILKNAMAYESITAQEAYDIMLADEGASMLDVRSLEELYWVGSPAFEPGGSPISYVVPWQFYNLEYPSGDIGKPLNNDFLDIINYHFNKNEIIIIFCRSGGRSSDAASALEADGFFNVYEIDNYMKDGRGGFQGSDYSFKYDGYRGYPERLPSNMSPHKIKVKADSDKITNPDDSVAWMDLGLPITQKIDKELILHAPPE